MSLTSEQFQDVLQVCSKRSMISSARMQNLLRLALDCINTNKTGAFVEAGVWKGGAVSLLTYLAKFENKNRQVFALDSFEGLPEPGEFDIETHSNILAINQWENKSWCINWCTAGLQELEESLKLVKCAQDDIHVVKGFFENTVPGWNTPIAILRCDADWYSSTKCLLENMYQYVVPGGYVIFDDYGWWKGCQKAVDEFIEQNKLQVVLINTDDTEYWFQKPYN